MMHLPVLIVDDEPDIRELLRLTLTRMSLEVEEAATVHAALELLSKHSFSLCITDLRLEDGDGLTLIDFISRQRPELPVAVISAHGTMELAIRALKQGAFDFVSKPIDLPVLRTMVQTALNLQETSSVKRPSSRYLLGRSPVMDTLRSKISKLARSQAPVQICGPSGVGKELVARMIHEQGPRAKGPFVPVNCGAIPSELMESEFFGHKRGSFTGAVTDKEGLFQAAEGGTLFLDEVAELPMPMQVKLLRAIQEKAVRAVGAGKEIPVDVRLLSATHQDLHALVESGRFRQDLFYRINVIELRVPSLVERREDIPLLAEHFLDQYASSKGRPHLTPSALVALSAHSFPGNIRELENILERALTLCEGTSIHAEDLALTLTDTHTEATLPKEALPASELETYLGDVESKRILEALEQTRWNKTQAAKKLGITLRALRYRLKKLGIDQCKPSMKNAD